MVEAEEPAMPPQGPRSPADLDPDTREMLRGQLLLIEGLAERIGGPEASVEDVFPPPTAVRQDAPMPEWGGDEEKVAAAYEVADSLYFGSETDVNSGLTRTAQMLEGGLAHKVAAEKKAAEDAAEKDPDGRPIYRIFAGSTARKLRQDELDFLAEQYDVTHLTTESTEFDMVSVLAAHTPDFQGGAKPFPEKYGYKLDEGNTFIDDVEPEDAQLIILGHDGDTLVGVLKVDREDYFDADAGEEKYRNQPGTERRMGFIAEYLTAIGNSITDVEVVTSNAYASRVPQAIAAGLQYDGGRQFGVTMYGRATMAEVRGEEMQPGVPLNQLPGDLRVYYDGVQRVMELSS